MPTIVIEITADDVVGVGPSCTGACVARRALRRMGLVGDVQPDRIRLRREEPGRWHEVDTPGQLRRFMRLFDRGLKLAPPTVTLDLPEDWPDHEPQAGRRAEVTGSHRDPGRRRARRSPSR